MNKSIRITASASLFLLVAGIFLFPTYIALAQDFSQPYQPLTTLPGLFTAGQATNPVEIIKGIYGLAIGIGSVIATVMIIWAGFEYMYQESITGKSGAKERITNAFLGLLVILSSYILLRTINPDLVNFSLTLEGGSGKVQNLIAIQKDFDDAQIKIREAQVAAANISASVKELDKTIEGVKASLASTSPDEIANRPAYTKLLEELEQSRALAALDEKYIRATGGLDLNISSMEENLANGMNGNLAVNTKRGLDNIAEVRAALEESFKKNQAPATAAKLKDLDQQEVLFRAQAKQLVLIDAVNKNSSNGNRELIAPQIKAVGAAAATVLTNQGRPDLVKRIQDETTRRVSIVCPKCK